MKRITERIRRIIISKHFKRYAPLAIVIIVAAATFATCSPWKDPEPSLEQASYATREDPVLSEPAPEPEPEPDNEPEFEPEPDHEYAVYAHPLTGLPVSSDMTAIRPLAIMINNAPDAQPQLGVSRADIIYEVPVEGGRTRMLALYQDVTDVGVIGSIRSSRAYFVDIEQSYDAVYIFGGGSPEAYSILAARDITRLDGVNGTRTQIFYRDRQRSQTMLFEHTLVTSGELISRWLPTYNFRLEHPDGYKPNLTFAEDGTPPGGSPAEDFTVRFSSGKSTTFSYLADQKLYYLGQFGKSYKDGNDDTQLSFTNVLILKTSVANIPGDSEGRLRIATTGSGTGWFICGGEYIEIEWSRNDVSSQFEYTLKDGTELVFGQGKTYICIVPLATTMAFE